MKKLFIFSLLLLFSISSFCQEIQDKTNLASDRYITISKSQKRTGLIFLGVGVGIGGIGIYKWTKNWWNVIRPNLVVGGVATLISIPLFIGAGINAKKARNAALSFKLEQNQFEQFSQSGYSSAPAISIKLNL